MTRWGDVAVTVTRPWSRRLPGSVWSPLLIALATLIPSRLGRLVGESAQVIGTNDAVNDGQHVGVTMRGVIIMESRDPLDRSAQAGFQLAHRAPGESADVEVSVRVLGDRVRTDREAEVAGAAARGMLIQPLVGLDAVHAPLLVPEITRDLARSASGAVADVAYVPLGVSQRARVGGFDDRHGQALLGDTSSSGNWSGSAVCRSDQASRRARSRTLRASSRSTPLARVKPA